MVAPSGMEVPAYPTRLESPAHRPARIAPAQGDYPMGSLMLAAAQFARSFQEVPLLNEAALLGPRRAVLE